MKKAFVLFLCAALLTAALCFAGCGKKAPHTDAPSPETTEAEPLTEEAFRRFLDDMAELPEVYKTAYVRGVTSGDALVRELAEGDDELLRLHTDASDLVKIPAGNYDKELIFDAANAGLVSDGYVGIVCVYAAGKDGVTLNGNVGTLAVYGEDVNVTLAGGAGTVYVQGKDCTVRLTGGAYGTIVSVNQTVTFVNETDGDVTIYMANGAPQTVKAGETLSFN